MTDDEFKTAFRALERVEPSPDFMQRARSIPLRHPRETTPFSLWQLFRVPSRLMAVGLSAICGLGVGYLTLGDETRDAELSAFLELGMDDTNLPNATDLGWEAP